MLSLSRGQYIPLRRLPDLRIYIPIYPRSSMQLTVSLMAQSPREADSISSKHDPTQADGVSQDDAGTPGQELLEKSDSGSSLSKYLKHYKPQPSSSSSSSSSSTEQTPKARCLCRCHGPKRPRNQPSFSISLPGLFTASISGGQNAASLCHECLCAPLPTQAWIRFWFPSRCMKQEYDLCFLVDHAAHINLALRPIRRIPPSHPIYWGLYLADSTSIRGMMLRDGISIKDNLGLGYDNILEVYT
jgi:hypothetical protein